MGVFLSKKKVRIQEKPPKGLTNCPIGVIIRVSIRLLLLGEQNNKKKVRLMVVDELLDDIPEVARQSKKTK